MKKKPREDEIRIAAEAARWQRALENGGPEVRAEFVDWVKASPRHLREFMFMEALDAAATNIDPNHPIDTDLDFSRLEGKVVPLPESSGASSSPALLLDEGGSEGRRRIPARPFGTLALAAGLLAAALGLAWWFMPGVFGGWERYSTTIGEQRTVELSDGSVLQLNTRSRVQVRLRQHSREIRLQEGEALFKVAHDASRPFRVHTDVAVIRAVGTQFNVYRRPSGTVVAVIEGKVEVRPVLAGVPAATAASTGPDKPSGPGSAIPQPSPSVTPSASLRKDLPLRQDEDPQGREDLAVGNVQVLAAGEAARIDDGGRIVRDVVNDISEATAWRQRRLVFREETLANIAEEFNRYNRSPQIVVEGNAARNRRYGGTFDADDPDSLAQFVTRESDLDVERSASRIVIRGK